MTQIISEIEARKVLIIDSGVDFCLLMQHYLRKKNCEVDCVVNIEDGLEFIELNRPDVIIGDAGTNPDLPGIIQNKVSSMHNYAPSTFFNDTCSTPYSRPVDNRRTLLDEIKDLIKAISDIFKS